MAAVCHPGAQEQEKHRHDYRYRGIDRHGDGDAPAVTAATPLAPILTALTADLFRAGLPGRRRGAATEPSNGARSGPAGTPAVSAGRSA